MPRRSLRVRHGDDANCFAHRVSHAKHSPRARARQRLSKIVPCGLSGVAACVGSWSGRAGIAIGGGDFTGRGSAATLGVREFDPSGVTASAAAGALAEAAAATARADSASSPGLAAEDDVSIAEACAAVAEDEVPVFETSRGPTTKLNNAKTVIATPNASTPIVRELSSRFDGPSAPRGCCQLCAVW